MSDKIFQLDDTDRAIIAALQKNGRESYKNIAKDLDVSDGTVRLRVEKMVKAKFLRISASVDPLFFENYIVAQVGISLDAPANTAIMEEIARLKGVQSVNNVTGRFDLVIEIFVESRKELRHFLVEELPLISGFRGSESFVLLESINKWAELPD